MSEKDFSGLHIDSDWKQEAAKEKERLSQQEKSSRSAGVPLPGTANFLELVNLLAMQAAISLGGFQGPGGERIPPNPMAAKHQIDLLDVLDQKTRGNLTEEEKRALDAVVYELRMQYVQMMSGPPAPGPGPR
ncbi:MAG: DUF1844 domain-containing protein [Planctomycetes bacterium]|nr:DUF1844 domain-containing protein [Planctomycetota bacterium]